MRQTLFASPTYLARLGAPVAPDDLDQHVTVGYLHAETPSTWTLQGPDRAVTVTPRTRLSVGSSVVLRDLLISGHGIGELPDFLSSPAERARHLARVLPQHNLPERRVFAVTTSRRGVDAKALAFIDHLQTALTGQS